MKTTVWTLTVDDNHGTATTVHGSEREVDAALRKLVEGDDDAPVADEELSEYLTEHCGICLWIESHEIDVTQPKPSGVHAWMRPSDILTALNTAIEDINEEANLDANPHGTLDALNLMLNYTYDQLFHGVTNLEDCVAASYDDTTLDDVIGWIKR
jgi:hypothetical protein